MNEKIATVNGLFLFPIKSCGGLSLDKAIVTRYGLALPENPNVRDRKWLIVDPNGHFVTQRKLPKMALIQPQFRGDFMILSAPGMPELSVDIQPPKHKLKCKVWDSEVDGYAYGDEVAKWISDYLEQDLDLVCFGSDLKPRRAIDDKHKIENVKESDETMYADYSPFMIMSENTINDLNSRLENKVTVRNFRPNIYVRDCDAYNEDKWTNFRIRDVKFRVINQGTRCLLTTVDPNKGVKSCNQEPLNTLKTYRVNREDYGLSPLLGVNVGIDYIGKDHLISVNDEIFVTDSN